MPRRKRPARKRVLTELFVKKVNPEKSRVLIWDLKQHGLVLVVEPTGTKAWKTIYSFHGRPRWLHIGRASAIGLADAVEPGQGFVPAIFVLRFPRSRQ